MSDNSYLPPQQPTNNIIPPTTSQFVYPYPRPPPYQQPMNCVCYCQNPYPPMYNFPGFSQESPTRQKSNKKSVNIVKPPPKETGKRRFPSYYNPFYNYHPYNFYPYYNNPYNCYHDDSSSDDDDY